MGVFFHILSTGVGSGASRTTRYIAERDKDLSREGPGSRPLFSEDQDNLSYHKADRILDPYLGRPEKNDLIHFSVMITEEDFDKLGADEKEKQESFREMIREGMKGMASELNVEELVWTAGIHRNTPNPHAHIVMSKNVIELGTQRPGRVARIPKRLLPYRETRNGKEVIVNGRIGDRFVKALENQQSPHRSKGKQPQLTPTETWERLVKKYQRAQQRMDRASQGRSIPEPVELRSPNRGEASSRWISTSLDVKQISASWNRETPLPQDRSHEFRLALGKRLTLEYRLTFAEAWHERAVQHGDTYRFEVVDQSTGDERNISEFDVRRRAAGRASRVSQGDHASFNEAIEMDLARHSDTLQQLNEAREAKLAALGKDIGSLRAKLTTVERSIAMHHEMPEREAIPLISRETLSELQAQSVKLNLPERVEELEKFRIALAREHEAHTRDETENATLAAQLNVARADMLAKDARLENFEASVHLASYEVGDDRWSLAALDKQILRRREDSKVIPDSAVRLDLRSLAHINYSVADREQAATDVEYLIAVRREIVLQIEQRREPLIADRDLSKEMLGVLENAYASEERLYVRNGQNMPEPIYERHQINSLEASAEILRDSNLLREVHEWEKQASKSDSEIDWEGRAVAREITSQLAVEQRQERLQHFLESRNVASLHIGEHRTGSLRQVEARTLTDYLARAIESHAHREFRHSVKTAAKDNHGRLINDFEKASSYNEAARALASETNKREPKFTDKDKINLEIYAERQTDPQGRERLMELARASESRPQEREVSVSVLRGR
jgi:hypothetical protein